MSSSPRFSIVIPTRERHRTLAFTLQTFTDQPFDDYEVVVCDNYSSPPTRQVVEAAQSVNPRIRYVRAPKPLAMSDNWELALGRAAGEFVTFIGDDDGIMPYGLVEADQLLRKYGGPILHAPSITYTWPELIIPEGRNFLWISPGRAERTVRSRDAIAEVNAGREYYNTLPGLYRNGFIHRDLIAEFRSRAGRVFGTAIPDVYTAFGFALLVDYYPSVEVPLTVEGVSEYSNGFSIYHGDDTSIAEEFDRLNREAGLTTHHLTPAVTPTAWIVPDSFLRAVENLGVPNARELLDLRDVARQTMADLYTKDPARRKFAIDAIRKALAGDSDALCWFESTEPERQPPAQRYYFLPIAGFHNTKWMVRTGKLGVANVVDAARLAADLLGYEAGKIVYGGEHSVALQRVTTDRDRVVGERDQIAGERDRVTGERDRIAGECDRIAGERDRLLRERDELAILVRDSALRHLPRRLLKKVGRLFRRRAA
jgi:glycosyltransferase involved in cell wall biosynthesis